MNKAAILSALPFQNKKIMVEQSQTTADIIKGILEKDNQCKNDYLKISYLFAGSNPVETAKNVFNFLQQNSKYKIESEYNQTLRSPAAIVAMGKNGIDCKSYALFTNGILDAERTRTGKDYELFYRFAGYNGKDIGHVFAVLKYKGHEYWIDNVLPTFNNRSVIPSSFKDKKVMSLYSINGINEYSLYPGYTTIGKGRKTWPVVPQSQMGNIFFEAKRLALAGQRNEILKKLDPFADAFIYGYIPTGAFAQNPNAKDFFALYNLPEAVRRKRDMIYPQFQKLQKATGLRETEFWPALRAIYNTRYGMSPEAFLSKKLGFVNPTIADKETVVNGVKMGAFQVAAAMATLQTIKDAAKAIFGDAATAVDFAAIAPDINDWQGWRNPQTGKDATDLFKDLAATSSGGGDTGTGGGSGSGSGGSGSKIVVPLLLAGAAFLLFK